MTKAQVLPQCRVIVQATGDICGKPAESVVVFKDNDRTAACMDCTIRMQQQYPGAIVKVERWVP
jgi:hypothetical protein